MTYRSKKTRTAASSKAKDKKIQSVEDVVAQVLRDVANAEVQDGETLRNSWCEQSTEQAAMNQPTQVTSTAEDDARPSLRNTSARDSSVPSPNQPFSTDHAPRLRAGPAGRRRALRSQDNDVQPNHGVAPRGAQALETQLSSNGNIWADDPSMTEPRQTTITEVNDVRPNKRSLSVRQLSSNGNIFADDPSMTEPRQTTITEKIAVPDNMMTYKTKKIRVVATSKAKDTKIQSVADVAAQVVHDVATAEAQDEETLRSSCCKQSTEQAAMNQPTQVTSTAEDDARPSLRNTSARDSFAPSPNQPFSTDHAPRFRLGPAGRRRALRAHDNSVQPNHGVAPRGAQALETQVNSNGNIWADDPSMTEPRQLTITEVNDVRPNKRSLSGRQLHTPTPSQPHAADSPSQPRASKRQSFWLVEDNEEPFQQGMSQGKRSKPAKWTDDIEFDEKEEVELRDLQGRRGKKGGKILPRHVWSLQPGVRFVVPVNALDQPVRKGGHILVKFLGDVAKNGELCPIGEVNWQKVDKHCKADIIKLIREKFVLPAREKIDKSILKHVGKKWRAYRYELKAQFKKPDRKQEQVASIVPKGVDASQWIKLVQYWFSERSQGKEARALQSHLQTTGAKCFARKRDEFKKAHGREPEAVEKFAQAHSRKDGTHVEDYSKEYLDAAAATVTQRGSTSSPTKHTAIENQVFNEIMYSDDERGQRPIGYGFGANRNKIFGVGGELRKRGYLASGTSPEVRTTTRNKLLGIGGEPKRSDYLATDTSTEVERLNFVMESMSETNEIMQARIQMQSQQLKMQSQQLQIQSKQMEGLQIQLQKVTSMLTKFGVMLNNPQIDPTSRGISRQDINNAQVSEASSEYTDSDSDSIEWDSDQ